MPMKKAVLGFNLSKGSQIENENYQRMMKLLIFSMVKTRSKIVFSIKVTAYFAKNPSYAHTEVIKTIV